MTPSTTWCKDYDTQAAQLQALIDPVLGTGSGLALVGHSNGGIVGRAFNRLTQRNDRIISIGSPHLGAPLVTNYLNGTIRNFGVAMANAIALLSVCRTK